MWDFVLVLGHVPGTNIDITFNELIIGIPLFLVGYFLLGHFKYSLKHGGASLLAGSRQTFSHLQHKLAFRHLAR